MRARSGNRVVGIYLPTRTVAEDPGYLEALQQDVGLNLVILSGGYTLSPEVTALNPLGSGRQGPGFSWDSDDVLIKRAIDVAHRRNVRVWLLLGCWQIGAEKHPELCARDHWGRRLTDYPAFPYCSEQRSLTFCPTDEAINAFYEAAYSDVVRRYLVDGLDITHARYTSPAFWPAVFSCACERCAALAESLGYEWSRLHESCASTVENLRALDAAMLRRFVEPGMGIGDVLQIATGHRGLLEWLDFRATVIARNLQRFRDAVHRAAPDRSIVFGVDNFPPSVALLAGHRYADFRTSCDYMSPLLSHPAYFVLATVQSWAHTLTTWVKGLDEAAAIECVARLLGFDRLPLPRQLAALGNGLPESEPDVRGLEELVRHDLAKARLYTPDALPSYPVLMGGLWAPDVVRRLSDAALDLGHDGVIYQQSSALTSYVPQ